MFGKVQMWQFHTPIHIRSGNCQFKYVKLPDYHMVTGTLLVAALLILRSLVAALLSLAFKTLRHSCGPAYTLQPRGCSPVCVLRKTVLLVQLC